MIIRERTWLSCCARVKACPRWRLEKTRVLKGRAGALSEWLRQISDQIGSYDFEWSLRSVYFHGFHERIAYSHDLVLIDRFDHRERKRIGTRLADQCACRKTHKVCPLSGST